jgi:two-component system chemotaxis response regulator CheY
VTDLEMPECDGVQLTRRLRATEADGPSPVLLYSAAPVERLHSAASASGASGWLQKPADPAALTSTIERLLDGGDTDEPAVPTVLPEKRSSPERHHDRP